jgi:hypothetical protein
MNDLLNFNENNTSKNNESAFAVNKAFSTEKIKAINKSSKSLFNESIQDSADKYDSTLFTASDDIS